MATEKKHILGQNFLISLDGKVLAGQRTCKINSTMTAIDGSCKDMGTAKRTFAGTEEWSIDSDGLVFLTQEAFISLYEAYKAKQPVEVKVESSIDKIAFKGQASIMELPLEMNQDGVMTYTIKFAGCSDLVMEQLTEA